MPKPRNGDLFAIPMPAGAGFVTAHVLLSNKDQKAGPLFKRSPLDSRGALLLDVYGPATPEPVLEMSTRLVHGVWTDAYEFTDGKPRWQSAGTRPVDPRDVEYPEWILNRGKTTFERGEIRRTLPLPTSEIDKIECRQPFITLGRLAGICVNLIGRRELLGEEAILFELEGSIDLRYHPRRAEIYELMGEDPNRSYWDWATAEGLDPGRFW